MDDDVTRPKLKPLPFTDAAAGQAGKGCDAPGTDPYKAMGTPDNSEISRLVLIMGKDGFKPGATAYYFLQYVHIGLGEFGFDAGGQFSPSCSPTFSRSCHGRGHQPAANLRLYRPKADAVDSPGGSGFPVW